MDTFRDGGRVQAWTGVAPALARIHGLRYRFGLGFRHWVRVLGWAGVQSTVRVYDLVGVYAWVRAYAQFMV